MKRLRPFFSYYGAKWTLAPRYPAPRHDTIIEPFAGSACYSLLYPERRVILIERDPHVAATWRYLLGASADEIRALPDLPPDTRRDSLGLVDGASELIGWWTGFAPHSQRQTITSARLERARDTRGAKLWGGAVRERIASQIDHIRHWTLIEGDAIDDAPDVMATWFVDPPYEVAGKRYRTRFERYGDLAEWMLSRRGQVIACEAPGATWLPQGHIAEIGRVHGAALSTRGTAAREIVWTNHVRDEGGQTLLRL